MCVRHRGAGSAAGEAASALGVGRGVVQLVVVIERRLVRPGELLAMLLDIGRGLDLLRGRGDLQLIGADLDAAKWYEGQVAADEALLDGRELRLVGLDIDIDILKLADPLPVAIDQHLPVPLGDVPLRVLLVLAGHASLLLRSLTGQTYSRPRFNA